MNRSAGIRVRVGAIVTIDDRLLLVRQGRDGHSRWMLPGGGVEHGETVADAIVRELREECGLVAASVEGPVALAESIAPFAGGRHVVHLLFRVGVDAGADAIAIADPDILEHRLVAPSEVASLTVHPPIASFLEHQRPGDAFVALGRVWVD